MASKSSGTAPQLLETKDLSALDPLFEPWEIPTSHRAKADRDGAPADVMPGRRPSPIAIAQFLRREVADWRENRYPGASDTTRILFSHWFERSHRIAKETGAIDFRYYFCQREALETLVYLREIRGITTVSRLVDEFSGVGGHELALGVEETEDLFPRYAFKIATGAGKTKIMSLAMAWSYFHALRESDSPMASAFVVIAPNLTVYERLKDDFEGGRIFDEDPVIPSEWKGDWNLSVVCQDGAGGGAAGISGGVLYLTNIHRLYPEDRRRTPAETYGFMGPAVSKASALDTGASLRHRIASHGRIMVMNDEAHHVWDPGSAWNAAIAALHDGCRGVGGEGIVSQLDLSATPKDSRGQTFKHVVCDTPLGEAVDAGIVKTPVIGTSNTRLPKSASRDPAVKYESHLMLGYECWKRSRDEWKKTGKKPLMFVMCEDTEAADAIARRLDSDERFKDLNGKTINLHTNLKGKLKRSGAGRDAPYEFVEDEKGISDDDLRVLRQLSRDLDSDASPYVCIVSVLMLREGWDVRNVTTIVPLRAFTAESRILPEQTLGRGLRRMTCPGKAGAHEVVTVVEHPAFSHLYDQELAQEGLFVQVRDAEKLPSNTVSIFPDPKKKDDGLDIVIPYLDPGFALSPTLPGIRWKEVADRFARSGLPRLPLESSTSNSIEYEGKALITGELIEKFKLDLPLVSNPIGAISYFRMQVEEICRLRNTHAILAGLIERFLLEEAFEEKVELSDERLARRLGDEDVQEYVRAVFVPLAREKTVHERTRLAGPDERRLSTWKPYQVTVNERHPVERSASTLFNLVPCDSSVERAFARMMTSMPDVVAFAKNAGPECLRIDYMMSSGAIGFYVPDFFVRTRDGSMYLVETKGRVDIDVPGKATAAVGWCEAASSSGARWSFVFVKQDAFESFNGSSFQELVRRCEPDLVAILEEPSVNELPLFAANLEGTDDRRLDIGMFAAEKDVAYLPERYRNAVEQSAELFLFLARKQGMNFAPAFNALLGVIDDSATRMLRMRLTSFLPSDTDEQKKFFGAKLPTGGTDKHFVEMANNLKRTLVFGHGLSPIGLLRSCLAFSLEDRSGLSGVFQAVSVAFRFNGSEHLLEAVTSVNELRNKYVAHQEHDLVDKDMAIAQLKHWIRTIITLTKAANAA